MYRQSWKVRCFSPLPIAKQTHDVGRLTTVSKKAAINRLIKLTASKGRNDEFVRIPPSVIVLALEAMLLIRICCNPTRPPLRSSASESPKGCQERSEI